MKLEELMSTAAEGAVLVHTTRAGERVLKKGRVLDAEDVAALVAAGVERVTCARLDPQDLGEDEAARALARALAGPNVELEEAKTGRCNLRATAGGLCLVDAQRLTALNARDERVTAATLADGVAVRAGDLVATIKIIPFAVPRALLQEIIDNVRMSDRSPEVRMSDDTVSGEARRARSTQNVRDADDPNAGHYDPVSGQSARGAVAAVAPWLGKRAGLVMTRFAATHELLLRRAEAAQRERMARCGGLLAATIVTAHEVGAVAQAIGELARAGLSPILVLGASAIMDRADVIPRAVEAAGGSVDRLGMPVDPGNLMMIGHLSDGRTVFGVPGCARSLKRSGFDWLLERECAGVAWTDAEIAALGAGGLLDEGELRPTPRQGERPDIGARRALAAIVLAAGRSSRMGSAKLLELLQGRPLVRWAVEAACASGAQPVIVVTGHRGDEVAAALEGLPVTLVENPSYAEGLASSLCAGLRALQDKAPDVDGTVICLGDMPRVTSSHLARLFSAFDPETAPIVVPTAERKRGNPVIWARQYFPELLELQGDVGARGVLERHIERVCFLPFDDSAILLDVDTPQALAALRSSVESED